MRSVSRALHPARLSKPQPHDTARWPMLADGGGMVTAMKRFITLRTDGNRVLVALDDWSVGMDRMMACQANDIRREVHRQLTYPIGVLSAFWYADATPEDDATYRNVTLLLAAPALRSICISMR
jgi:hypothetical protein